MWRKILWIFFKYVVYTLLLCVLIAFLAKTHNMPAAVPEEYVQKIIEITDRVLISLNLIKDERLKARYLAVSARKTTEKYGIRADTYINRNPVSRLINYLLFNGYDIRHEKILNRISSQWNSKLKKSLERLNNIAENPYIKSAILESETGVIDYYTSSFLNSIIRDLKMIAGFVIIENDKLVKFIKKENLDITSSDISKFISEAKKSQQILSFKNYFLYTYESTQAAYKVWFILYPSYFSEIPFEIFPENNLFLFNQNYRIITAKTTDRTLIEKIENALISGEFLYNGLGFKTKYIKLSLVENLYLGIYYKKYPVWKVLLNIFIFLLIVAGIVITGFLVKYTIEKIKYYRTRTRSDELEIITGALMEVAKSVKLAADAAEKASQLARFESENVKSIVRDLKKVTITTESLPTDVQIKEKTSFKKEIEWKLIEE